MTRPNEQLLVDIIGAILGTVAPVGIVVVLLVFRDRRGRFSLSMLLTLVTLVALAAWAWGRILRHQ